MEKTKKTWESDRCDHALSYYSVYPVPLAAALWCGIPPDEVQAYLSESTEISSAVYRHPLIKCLEPRCRALHEAIESGALPVNRESGGSFDGSKVHVAPNRRHVTRTNLKEWIAREFPSDRPEFLFDEIERTTHAAITTDSFLALQADRDAARAELKKAEAWAEETLREMDAIRGERDSLRLMVEKQNAPGAKAEATYLNIIGAMLTLMLGKTPTGEPQSVFSHQSAIITALLERFSNKSGISARTLEDKFAAAKRSLNES